MIDRDHKLPLTRQAKLLDIRCREGEERSESELRQLG